MLSPPSQQYEIPSARLHIGFIPLLPLVLLPLLAAITPGFAIELGLFIGVPITVVWIFVAVGRSKRQAKKVWDQHSYEWYRSTFPEHAHKNGMVSCRRCNGGRLQVRNLLNHTYTRLHSCSQCGETLYFSPEKV